MFTHRLADDLELRLLEERHAEELFQVIDRSRAHIRRWMNWVDGVTGPDDQRAFIRRALEQFARNEGFHTGIWLKGALIGCIGCHFVNWVNRKTELGYWLAESAQGRGIMTRACAAVVDHAFTEWKLHRVLIHCAAENRRSRAIPERLGFTQEGVLRQSEWLYDHFVDLVAYGLLAPEWRRPDFIRPAPAV